MEMETDLERLVSSLDDILIRVSLSSGPSQLIQATLYFWRYGNKTQRLGHYDIQVEEFFAQELRPEHEK